MRLFFILLILLPVTLYSQNIYRTSGGEIIFSRTLSNHPVLDTQSKIRVSAFLHYNVNYHFDFSSNLGAYTGLSVSNIGFIYKNQDTTYKKRAYAVGIPVALKLGNLDNNKYLFAGGELEIPFHFKQKRITGKEKNKYSSFFDERVNTFIPSVFAGIQFSEGWCLKLRLHLKDYLNKDFQGNDFGKAVSYRNIESQLFLISVSYNLRKIKAEKSAKETDRFANLNI